MPKVGTKTFPYTSAGHQQAQKHARSTGQKMMMKKGGKVKKGYRKGGLKKGKQEKIMEKIKSMWNDLSKKGKIGIVALIVIVVIIIVNAI